MVAAGEGPAITAAPGGSACVFHAPGFCKGLPGIQGRAIRDGHIGDKGSVIGSGMINKIHARARVGRIITQDTIPKP